jgi:hypothetical protein
MTVPTSDTMEHMLFPTDFNFQHSMRNCQSRLANFVALNSFWRSQPGISWLYEHSGINPWGIICPHLTDTSPLAALTIDKTWHWLSLTQPSAFRTQPDYINENFHQMAQRSVIHVGSALGKHCTNHMHRSGLKRVECFLRSTLTFTQVQSTKYLHKGRPTPRIPPCAHPDTKFWELLRNKGSSTVKQKPICPHSSRLRTMLMLSSSLTLTKLSILHYI